MPAYPPRLNRPMPALRSIAADARASAVLTTTPVMSSMVRRLAYIPELEPLCWLSTDHLDTDPAEEWREPAVDDESLAFLQYTSGSAAAPKGVMLTHGNLLHNSSMIYRRFKHEPDTRVVSWLPPYHDMGLIGGILQPLYGGFPATLMSPMAFLQRPLLWLQTISRTGGNTSGAQNFAYELCSQRISAEERDTLDLSSWDVAFSGAEPIRRETLERFVEKFGPCGFRGEAFYPCYGLAEATLLVSAGSKAAPPIVFPVQAAKLEHDRVVAASVDDKDARTLIGCGHTLPGQEIVVVSPESFTRCQPDQVGEIWVSGPSVARGYWNRPHETEQTFLARLADTGEGPFLRTGDLGFLRDGELFITGRLKDLIIIRGRNHYPQDIELTAELSHEALRPGCCAAFSAADEGQEERLVVIGELKRRYRRSANASEVVAAVRRAVAEFHKLRIHDVSLIKPGSIPKTSSGKIRRSACRKSFLDGTLDLADLRKERA